MDASLHGHTWDEKYNHCSTTDGPLSVSTMKKSGSFPSPRKHRSQFEAKNPNRHNQTWLSRDVSPTLLNQVSSISPITFSPPFFPYCLTDAGFSSLHTPTALGCGEEYWHFRAEFSKRFSKDVHSYWRWSAFWTSKPALKRSSFMSLTQGVQFLPWY